MGYTQHDAVVAVVSDYDKGTLAAIEAFRATLGNDGFNWSKCLLGPVPGVNGETTYVWAPDGSKEGWSTSDRGDELRDQFIQIARGKRYEDGSGSGSGDVIHVRFGGDHGYEHGSEIVYSTDPVVRRYARVTPTTGETDQ